MDKRSALCYLALIVLIFSASSSSIAQSTNKSTRMGISATMGLGAFVAEDKNYYGGISTDVYPEIGLGLDVWMLRAGLKIGFIYRKYEMWIYEYDPYYGDYSFYDKYVMSYAPVQVDLMFCPFNNESGKSFVSPYVGISPGVFIATGDNEKNLAAVSFKIGMEITGGPLLAYGDLRYTYANHDTGYHTYKAGGIMLVIGGGFRLGK